jgi:hypothetical protein
VKRNLHALCADGVRKKAKYLHDAPDAALMPPVVGGHYPQMNENTPPIPGQVPGSMPLPQQTEFYTQAPAPITYYTQNPILAQLPTSLQNGSFDHSRPPISPSYNQTHQNQITGLPGAVTRGPPPNAQFVGPLFDPSDPGLFNFDISSLNFGNHYGALEMGMLGHIVSRVEEGPPSGTSLLNPMNQGMGAYTQQIPYSDGQNHPASLAFGPDGLPATEWQNMHSRQGSLHVHTPTSTQTTTTHDHRHDSLNGPHAYAIGHGTASLSSASPASTDVNATYETDNQMPVGDPFGVPSQQRGHRHENRSANTALRPAHQKTAVKMVSDTSWVYEINAPYNYVQAFHRLLSIVVKRYSAESISKIRESMTNWRGTLITSSAHLTERDLIHQERSLQRAIVELEESYTKVGVPSFFCRRTGEVVGMNKEFTYLTGWNRDVLLGQAPNLNINTGLGREKANENSTTPLVAGQEADSGLRPVSIIEIMDERSSVEWFEDLAELLYLNSRGTSDPRRVNLVRYRTAEGQEKTGPEVGISQLGVKDGLVDCMIQWHVKRDVMDSPMLICINVSGPLSSVPIALLIVSRFCPSWINLLREPVAWSTIWTYRTILRHKITMFQYPRPKTCMSLYADASAYMHDRSTRPLSPNNTISVLSVCSYLLCMFSCF